MKSLLPLLLLPALSVAAPAPPQPYGLVLHGGAGVILREKMSPEMDAQYRAKLGEALAQGYAILAGGGTALDAVNAVVNLLEDSPLFNAGKGAVFNAAGQCELDASIMDGRTLAAGAIAGVQHIRNPINLARDVMVRSPHVMMIGDGAEQFAQSLGYELVPNEYFQTDHRRQQLERARELEKNPQAKPAPPIHADVQHFVHEQKYGTVGCAALDQQGNLAAATSTGGMTNKKYGRVGDAPIIGAGTYASNATCAVSATGWGEFFIRVGVARDIAAQMEYQHRPLAEAAVASLAKVKALGGDGGVVGIDAHGNVAMEFNTAGMYRAHRVSGGPSVVAIYGDEAGK